MTDEIEGDWRMLIEDEALGAETTIYSFRDGMVIDPNRESVGSYEASDDGRYLITIGGMACSVSAGASGTIETLTGSIDQGEWSDPVTFLRMRFDVRAPDHLDGA
ncbi:hypothetical protein M0208_02720 [Sphingomonas sp. SUN019]|uniref:hypothetical protein n=1 Tax=Sphingomonas sp. SUN019 TaxID=2937788 RepID=UPI0021644C88|nr:hypothetical protein [Sphingomonas sp. SUN019]UVO49477.1 hypothetical protein M0208_02720 [Sphingomonas sp. SUN019]